MRLALVLALLTVTTATFASSIVPPFYVFHWSADGIIVCQIAALQELTVDLDVQEWFRDSTNASRAHIRAYRYQPPGLVPKETYEIGSRYLFLLRKPYAEGAGNNPHWIINLQHQLEGKAICLDDLDYGRLSAAGATCQKSVSEVSLLDALKTFDQCFRISESKSSGRYPAEQSCTNERVQVLSEQSIMHAVLIKAAKDRIQQGGP